MCFEGKRKIFKLNLTFFHKLLFQLCKHIEISKFSSTLVGFEMIIFFFIYTILYVGCKFGVIGSLS